MRTWMQDTIYASNGEHFETKTEFQCVRNKNLEEIKCILQIHIILVTIFLNPRRKIEAITLLSL